MTALVYRTPKNGDWRIARLENFEGSLPAVLKYINELEKTEVVNKNQYNADKAKTVSDNRRNFNP